MPNRTANLLGAAAQLASDEQLAAIAADTGMQASAAAALVTIGHAPGESIDALRTALRRSHSSVVRLVATLTDAGYVAKAAGADGRSVTLALTAAGTSAAERILSARNHALTRIVERLSRAEQEQLDHLLARVLDTAVRSEADSEVYAYQICRLCDGERCDPCPVEATFE